MQQLKIKPVIYQYDTAAQFVEEFRLGAGDLVLTNRRLYQRVFEKMNLECRVLFREDYGKGEPSDEMAEAIARDIPAGVKRIVAIGGGSILDLAKLYALKQTAPVLDLFDGKIPPVKDKELILVPTTCGTGSEVTNISILALLSRGTKKGLAHDSLYGDAAVLVPELLLDLPMSVFATSSIDALIHAVESSLSPKGNSFTRMFGYQAIRMILEGYQTLRDQGPEARNSLMKEFLLASNYAGIAFGNAGCGAVHALSYPLGAKYHVAHGESNYAMFTGVMRNYMELRRDGEIAVLNRYLAELLGCGEDAVYEELETLLNVLIPKKPLHAYGMTEGDLEEFTDSVLENQQRLLANNFVPFDRSRIYKIYRELY